MTTKSSERKQSRPGKNLLDALKGLLDRVRDEAEEIAGMLLPRGRQPALQPIPVRRPSGRRGR